MRGRFAGWPMDCVDIYNACSCDGNHIEIGTMFGGSAIIAALAKAENGYDGLIYCVDPLDGYYGRPFDPNTAGKITPSVEIVLENASLWGIEEMLRIFPQKHPPLPEELENMRFETALIDGDHSYKGALADWNNLKGRVDKYIIFHDIHKRNPRRIFEIAQEEWELFSARCNNGPPKGKAVTREHITCGVIGIVRKNG